MNEGWKCPGCYLIHAPFVKSCSCQQTLQHALEIPPTQGVGNILTAEQIHQQAEMNRKAQEARERAMEQAYSDALIYGRGSVQVQHVPQQNMYMHNSCEDDVL